MLLITYVAFGNRPEARDLARQYLFELRLPARSGLGDQKKQQPVKVLQHCRLLGIIHTPIF
jgi:hypothetical protein